MKAAILDDTKSDAQLLLEYIERFQAERNIVISGYAKNNNLQL